MKASFSKPQRSIKSELFTLLAVSLVPLGIILVFPYKAIGFNFKAKESTFAPFASLVFLTEAEEIEAIERARNTWQTSSVSAKVAEIDLSLENLPEFENAAVLENPIIHVRERSAAADLERIDLALPSIAASAPEKIEASPIESEKFFKDEDLMKLK